ncbi:hypothetical protein J7337_013850 [Fusarium musae]|uniref:Uncharacterized protein n=1 Tax=Fusarium musae TaxID=1042133 RepID=A0A9P8D3K7_9HYPO|nr:hypothetical protein J7337_013850 [Fusarium musae]KAG9494711.1 hypothetical protein J7337_013850 [Fusarium musae]
MTDKKSKPSKVDFIRQGREFGRFIRAHRTPANSYGFDKTDAAWIKKYCPESGEYDNEREYDKKWVTNPVSLSTTRNRWRKHMQELDNQEAFAAASSDRIPGAFPDNPIIQRPRETANAVNIVAPKPLRSRTLTQEWIQPGDEPELQGLQELDKATDHPVLGSECHQSAPLAHGLEPYDNASSVFEYQPRHATTHIPLNETYSAKATWRTLNDQQHPSNLMAQSRSLTDSMGKDTIAQGHQSSRAASAMPATSWNQASLEISQTKPPARQGSIVLSPQTDSRGASRVEAPFCTEKPRGGSILGGDAPAIYPNSTPYGPSILSAATTPSYQPPRLHITLVYIYTWPGVSTPSTSAVEIVNSLKSGPQGTGILEKRDSLSQRKKGDCNFKFEEIKPPNSKSKAKSRSKSKSRHRREKSRHEPSPELSSSDEEQRKSHPRGSRQRRDKEERKSRSRSTRYQDEEGELEELEKNFSKRERRGKKESDGGKEKKRSQSRHRR